MSIRGHCRVKIEIVSYVFHQIAFDLPPLAQNFMRCSPFLLKKWATIYKSVPQIELVSQNPVNVCVSFLHPISSVGQAAEMHLGCGIQSWA